VFPTLAEVQPWVQKGLTLFGFERGLFAGNWFFVNWLSPPILDGYTSWASMLTQALVNLGASGQQVDQLLRATATKVYRLE